MSSGQRVVYNGVWVCTTEYEFVLRSMSLYYGLWVCTKKYEFVLRSMSLYCGVRLCTTEREFVLQGMSLYYVVWVSTTVYEFVLRSMTLQYGVWVCTTEYEFVLRSASFALRSDYEFVLRSMISHYGVRVCTTGYCTIEYEIVFWSFIYSATFFNPSKNRKTQLSHRCSKTGTERVPKHQIHSVSYVLSRSANSFALRNKTLYCGV